MYKLNDIFYLDDEYSARADFCNEKGNLTIKEIEPDEKGRRFQIVEVTYSEVELASIEISQLEWWFNWYDEQTIQYQRSVRLGVEFDKDMAELDRLAVDNAKRIKELRTLIDLKN